MTNSYDIFLSFKATDQCGSTQDVAVANELYNTLTAYGFQVFFSNRTVPEIGNSDFSKEIDCALDTAQLLIVVASQFSLGGI